MSRPESNPAAKPVQPVSDSAVFDSPASDSYAQWVRRAIAMSRARGGETVSLFESSVPEPRELLRQAVLETVEPAFSEHYVSAFGDGNPFVRDTLADRYGVPREQVLCTTGATGALSLIYRALLKPGDHVLVEAPGFDLFTCLAHAQGVAVDGFARHGDRFAINVADLEAQLTPRTRLVVLSDLHNPSGMQLDEAILRALAQLAERRGFLLVVDEVYADYAEGDRRRGAAAALSSAVISISSLTKIYGLGVLRCGWIVGAQDTVARLRAFSGQVEFGVSTLSHAVAAQVLADADSFTAATRSVVARCRPRFEAWFDRMKAEGLMVGALPEDGCICFPSLPGIDDTRAFSEWLIGKAGVIVAPGEYFGAPGHIRIGFCQRDEHLEAGLSGLESGLRAFARSPRAARVG
ncbi:pyridoxal phosphate-dependent aminotransferase [Novosphingobium sp. UBA1939]|uniref:pyridoxal phosphate-dependent aminotransferase n=1 Tax=Novosphingobium sp. UBA1939 TaxID=1946982 RepID=UPI0025D4FC96|nr:pyridoxal phosphate-dependent aminotransferase [Novosphingobium sp. UBA1939]